MMRRAVLVGLASCLALAAAAEPALARVFVDGAGRRVEVPDRITKVFAAGGPASVLLYVLAPETLLGWSRALSPSERAYIPARYADLPTLGRLTGRANTANVEVVLRMRPDVIVDYGSVRPTYVSLADRVQEQTSIPYVLIDGSLSAAPAAFRALGGLLGAGARGEALARYAERVLGEVDRRVAKVPAERRPRVYYARGPRGLETGLRGSINVESLERIGARNVAAEGIGGGSLVRVSIEQILVWDPEVIVTVEPEVAQEIRRDPLWRGVRAVRDGRIHLAPQDPFPWIDFPPSVNRLMGLWWLGRVLYPGEFPEDLRTLTREFHALFYQRAPDDAQLDALLDVRPK
jgi:iron complex transport system substrate-binding protein